MESGKNLAGFLRKRKNNTTEEEIKRSHQMVIKNVREAALCFVKKEFSSQANAMEAFGLDKKKYRATMSYNVKHLEKCSSNISPSLNLLQPKFDDPIASIAENAEKKRSYSNAFKWMTANNSHQSNRKLAHEAQELFGVFVGEKAAATAKISPIGLSPKKRGPEPKYPRHLEKVIVEIVLKLRYIIILLQ